jgi:hypothetical protein
MSAAAVATMRESLTSGDDSNQTRERKDGF